MSDATSSWVDLHSHLVPGVDDGARDMEAVLSSVERMVALGIRRIVTTPHFKGSLSHDPVRYEARLSEISDAFALAKEAIAESFPDVEFLRGQEVLIDVPELDFSDPRLRLAGTSFVLVEWPRLQLPQGTIRVVEDIGQQGYRPVIAHPERYSGISKRLQLVGRWRELGALLQVNYGSLVGRYGSAAKAAAERLLQQGWVDYLASDFHGHSSLKIYKAEAEAYFGERDALDTLELLGKTNPARLLENMAPMPAPLLEDDPGLLNRLRDMWRGGG